MKFIVGYTRGYLYASDADFMECDFYESVQGLEESFDPDNTFKERSLVEAGFPVSDFYVLEDINGKKSYKPISLIDEIKRCYRFLMERVSPKTQDQF